MRVMHRPETVAEVHRAEDARRQQSADWIAKYQRGLITLAELVEQLADVIVDNPARLCWCGEVAAWVATVDAMVTLPQVRLGTGEAAIFVCSDHVGTQSGAAYSVDRMEGKDLEGWR
jgi:hypothetical protein